MPSRPLTFRQRDLAAAIRTVKAAGVSVARYEITKDGTISIVVGESAALENEAPDGVADQAVVEDFRQGLRSKKRNGARKAADSEREKAVSDLVQRMKAREIPRPCCWRDRPCDCPWTDFYDLGRLCPYKPRVGIE